MDDPEHVWKRLRQDSHSRFTSPQSAFDLEAVAGALAQEVGAGEAGRRQVTLYKHSATTIALFLFGHLTHLPPHRTNGTVVIHVLRGRLRVTAESQEHDLGAGQLLVLAAGVEHNVAAFEESAMLLTVHRDPVAAGVAAPPASERATAERAASERSTPAMLARALDRWDNEGGHPDHRRNSTAAPSPEGAVGAGRGDGVRPDRDPTSGPQSVG